MWYNKIECTPQCCPRHRVSLSLFVHEQSVVRCCCWWWWSLSSGTGSWRLEDESRAISSVSSMSSISSICRRAAPPVPERAHRPSSIERKPEAPFQQRDGRQRFFGPDGLKTSGTPGAGVRNGVTARQQEGKNRMRK